MLLKRKQYVNVSSYRHQKLTKSASYLLKTYMGYETMCGRQPDKRK